MLAYAVCTRVRVYQGGVQQRLIAMLQRRYKNKGNTNHEEHH